MQNIKEFCPIDNQKYFTLIIKTLSYYNFNYEYCCENCIATCCTDYDSKNQCF